MIVAYIGLGILGIGIMIIIVCLGASVYGFVLASRPNRVEVYSDYHEKLKSWSIAGLLTAIVGLVLMLISMLVTGRF